MKRKWIAILLFFYSVAATAQAIPFRFAFVSDTHIGSPDGSSEEDLRRTVRDINMLPGISFVVLTGDITELGKTSELVLAKSILDSLAIPWFIIPGNHDAGWSESGGMMFTTVFGYDKFSFEWAGIRFLACPSGPYMRMGDGHIPGDAVNWLDEELKKLKPGQPVIFLNHYPVDNSLDNWYEVTDRLRRCNVWAILCGHGHANKAMNFEEIPAVMGRSNLRAKAPLGGYNLVDVRTDSMIFSERRPGAKTLAPWTGIKIETRHFSTDRIFPRPSYSINDSFSRVSETWRFSSASNIISTPAIAGDDVIVGNQKGEVLCISLTDGRKKWTFQTEGSIFSSPAISKDRVVLGSADGSVYCLYIKNGKLDWKKQTGAPVLGSPLIHDNTVYIGGSKKFFAFDLKSGNRIWAFGELGGPVVSSPAWDKGNIIFGAWDTHLYSIDAGTGKLNWKWSNGSLIANYSPASCIPVLNDGTVFVVAPDRYISAIDAATGATLWRNNDATVRESIGISENGKWIYGKTMQDTIVAYAASREKQSAAWKMHCGFGYEHVPSMLIEKDGLVFFGTKNGVIYCINPDLQKIVWAHKIDNSMVNTVRVINGSTVLASTMDGKLVLIRAGAD